MGGDDRAQSEVVGNVLIVGIVVIGVSVAGAFYLSTIGSEDETFADVEVTLSNTSGPQATFTHQGGDAVDSSSLVVRVTRNGASLSPTLDPDASRGLADGRFDPGDHRVYNLTSPGPTPVQDGDAIRAILTTSSTDTVLVDETKTFDS
ncbi:type IV pilin [Salinirarus marinus]|uniref:type IV pilin n=1 Tax=Salinirarus marinus TaxID=3068310 RepID=UPI003C6BD6CB